MTKHFKTFHELHHTHLLTHKVLALIIFSIIILSAVIGSQRVRASWLNYALVPNGPPNVCYKINTDYNDTNNHLSCINYEKVCQTAYGVLVGCQSGRVIK